MWLPETTGLVCMLLRDLRISQGDPVPSWFSFTLLLLLPFPISFTSPFAPVFAKCSHCYVLQPLLYRHCLPMSSRYQGFQAIHHLNLLLFTVERIITTREELQGVYATDCIFLVFFELLLNTKKKLTAMQ